MTIGPVWRHITVMLSGSPLEGPVRRAFRALWSCIPDRMLSAAAVKARDYDRLTLQIAQRTLVGGGSAVDIGAHEGEILKWLVRLSPGPHWAFEPIPACAARLRKRFPDVTVEQAALSNFNGTAEFRFLPGAAGYSSLFAQPEIEAKQPVRLLQVEVRRLDDCIPAGVPVAFVKIDVEGAEAAVLQGAAQLLRRHRPVVVFECASAKLPSCVAALEGTGLDVSFLADFLERTHLPAEEVMRIGRERGEYYYVASAR